jgi:hypothetical protein
MPVDEHVSLASLLDDLRPLIIALRARGEQPRYVVLGHAAFDAVEAVKGADRKRGMPMIVLGLELVRADEPDAPPRVF